MKNYDILIVGAGSTGMPLAYYLAERKLKVAVIEKLPSSGRGQNRAAIGGLRATHSDPAKIKICQKSIEIIRNFKEEHGEDIGWFEGGYLYPVYDKNDEIKLKKLLEIQKSYNLNIDWISPEKTGNLVPGINMENLRGGTFSPEDGSASPIMTAGAYYRMATKLGADVFFNEEVVSMNIKNGKIESVKTTKDEYSAGIVINAAGGNARKIGEMCKIDLPVHPDCHEAGITEPVEHFFDPMVVDIRETENSSNYYFYQNSEGQVVFCITPKPSIYGEEIDNTSSFLPLVSKRMINLYPRLKNLKVRRTWRGLYPMTPDGYPIVSHVKEISNLFLNIGMCGQGYMMGPGLGKIITEILIDKTDKYNFILEMLTLYRNFDELEMLQ